MYYVIHSRTYTYDLIILDTKSTVCTGQLKIGAPRRLATCYGVKIKGLIARYTTTRYIDPILFQCWATVCDVSPASKQHWFVLTELS